MADSVLLNTFGSKSVKEFHKDIVAVLGIARDMDRYYSEANSDVDVYMEKFEKLIENFNKKYKGLSLKSVKKSDSLELNMLLSGKNLRDVFENSATKIVGLQSIGANSYGAAPVASAEQFAGELEKAKNKLYITYYNPETGSSKVFLQYDDKTKKVQLVYDENIENEPSTEFQIAAFYALSKGYDKKINVHDEAATFGFSDFPDHLKKRKYLDKHDPHLSE